MYFSGRSINNLVVEELSVCKRETGGKFITERIKHDFSF